MRASVTYLINMLLKMRDCVSDVTISLHGFRPSKAIGAQRAFNAAVDEVTHAAHHLLADLVSNAAPRDRAIEAAKKKAKAAERFGVAAR